VVKVGEKENQMTEEQYATNVEGSGETRSTKPPIGEPVWSYRGYHLGPGEFTTAMVHFFRAEVNRANVWRQPRLDNQLGGSAHGRYDHLYIQRAYRTSHRHPVEHAVDHGIPGDGDAPVSLL
jgi:hypothetical protein